MAGAAKVMRFGGKKDKVFLFFFFFGSKGEMWNSSEQKKEKKRRTGASFESKNFLKFKSGLFGFKRPRAN